MERDGSAAEGGEGSLDRSFEFRRRSVEAGPGDCSGHLAAAAVFADSPEIETEILPFALDGIGVIVYSPMASGLFTGAMTRERISKLPDNDWRSHDGEFLEPTLSANLALVERLRAVGANTGVLRVSVAIAWVLRHPAVTAAIVGARRRAGRDVVAAAPLQLIGRRSRGD